MADATAVIRDDQEVTRLRAEIVRLNKIIQSLMNRSERSANLQDSDFNLFQTAILLEDQVHRRTEDLEAALHKVQALQAQLREQALRDPLTGLYNRRYLTETFDRELLRAQRCARQVSVVMGDIDHFKLINDTHGHQAGDEVLKTFGELLTHYSRGSDINCRYGGEEFLLVLFDMVEDDACLRTEQLRQAFATTAITWEGTAIQATASFGVAVFPLDAQTSDMLIAAADAALYAAKDAGRNQVKRYAVPMRENM